MTTTEKLNEDDYYLFTYRMYLIDEKYLTDYTSVSLTKNAKDIKVAFQAATIISVKPLLGIALYELYENHLLTSNLLNRKQGELFEMIKYFMALKVEREMLFNLVNINNKGATEADKAASLELSTSMRQAVDSKAATVKKNILEFLKENKDDFPEYYPPATETQDFTGGIIFEPIRHIYIQ